MRHSALGVIFTASVLFGTATAASAEEPPVVTEDGVGLIGTGVGQDGLPGRRSPGGTAQPVGTGPRGESDPPACQYTRAESLDKPGPPPEQAYYRVCLEGNIQGGVSVVYLGPAAAGVLPPSVTPEQLAQRVRNTMQLPTPTVAVNPSGTQLVQFPVWWWVSNWQPLTQRTELGGSWAEVTATPLKSRFDSGYGESKECGQPGIPWSQGLPESHPYSCQFTYRKASESFTAQVAVTWRVTWVGSGGSGGVLAPMTMTATQPMRVLERRTVVVDGRG